MAMPGVDETNMRGLAEKLGGPIRPLAGNWALAGTAAIKAARAAMFHGASNRFFAEDRPIAQGWDPLGLRSAWLELKRWGGAAGATLEVDKVLDTWKTELDQPMLPSDPRRLENAEATGYLALTHNGGNCQYLAAGTFLILKAAGVRPLDLIWIWTKADKAKHATCVIGIPADVPNPNMPDYELWRETAVVADTWDSQMSEPAEVLDRKWPAAEHNYYSFARFG